MKKIIYYLLTAVIIGSTACEKTLIGPSGSTSDPVANLEAFYEGYKNFYGTFEVKGVDWDSLYSVHKAKVTKNTTNKELGDVFKSLLTPLNDIHCFVIPVNTPELPGRIESSLLFDTLKSQTDYREDVINNKYVNSMKQAGEGIEYGWLTGNIGYIHITSMSGSLKNNEVNMNEILDKMKDANGIVVDIRNNSGGDDRISKYIAGCFAPESKLFMKIRKRSGPGKDAFTPWQEWYVEPESKTFTKPVYLLTSRWSQSAAETFALAMRENSNVTLAGDYTAGGFSDVVAKELPNGWIYFVSVGDYRAADGVSYEGIGVPPDILIVNTKSEMSASQDKLLEYAIHALE